MKRFFLLLNHTFLVLPFLLASQLKNDLWYTVYEEAWQSARQLGKPLYLLVANERLDPYQLTLFERLTVREVLQEGFIPLIVSPYEELAFKLPIKALPATFIISAKGEALLSYQGLLWEDDFFRLVLPLASLDKKIFSLDLNFVNKSEKTFFNKDLADSQLCKEKELIKRIFSFEKGTFFYNGKKWVLKYQHKVRYLKTPSWKVLDYFILEDETQGIVYALPLEGNGMSYQMNKKTEIWKPFFLIEQKSADLSP